MPADNGGGLKAFIADAQENVKKLGACKGGHQFARLPDDVARPGRRFECSKCGGRVDWAALYWYKLGLEHGKGK